MRPSSIFVLLLAIAACQRASSPQGADVAFQQVQTRGAAVMGVDQYTSTHVFEDLTGGGRIVLDRQDASDSAGIRTIREHMRTIAAAFARGDFTAPGLVHARDVPGTDVMAARSSALHYAVVDRPAGAEVRITSDDPVAIDAVHRFLAFQRSDHRAVGHEGHAGHGAMPNASPPPAGGPSNR